MDSYCGEHDEDDIPIISLPHNRLTTYRTANDCHWQNDTPDRFVEDWRNLYESSMRCLDTHPENYEHYVENQHCYESMPFQTHSHESRDRTSSEVDIIQPISNPTDSKWQIDLPQLINSTVGPDRQKRNVIRRHTTQIIYQKSNTENGSSVPCLPTIPLCTDEDGEYSPLVQTLKTKFNRMIDLNSFGNPNQCSPRLDRTQSLLTKSRPSPRPALPVRFVPELYPKQYESHSSGLNNSITNIAEYSTIENRNAPANYSKRYFPSPPVNSIVRHVIDTGGTVVYDTKQAEDVPKDRRHVVKRYRTMENSGSNLSGKPRRSHQTSESSTLVHQQVSRNDNRDKMMQNEKNDNNYEKISNAYRNNASAKFESDDDNDDDPYYPTYNKK